MSAVFVHLLPIATAGLKSAVTVPTSTLHFLSKHLTANLVSIKANPHSTAPGWHGSACLSARSRFFVSLQDAAARILDNPHHGTSENRFTGVLAEVCVASATRCRYLTITNRKLKTNPDSPDGPATNPLPTWVSVAGLALALLAASGPGARASDSLSWNTNQSRVTADVRSLSVDRLLGRVAAATGWQVYLEPGTTRDVSAKFKDLPPGDALHLLLGDLNFAFVPETNAAPRLYVFRTSRSHATRLIRPADGKQGARQARIIPNELIVRLKPGANIADIARLLGAKVIGHIDGLNAYRLQFQDADAADAARAQLAANSDVTGVESNYIIDPPPAAVQVDPAGVPPLQLKLDPPGSSGRVVVGLVDTAVQPLGNNLDSFLLKSISVAGDATPDPNAPTHGTSMFEDILRSVAAATGGNSSVQVLSVDVYGPNPTTSTFDVASGIVQAVNSGANPINLSLGSPADSPILRDIIDQASQNGIVVVAAAGNDASTAPFYPAAYQPEVLSVTASAGNQLASYANYGTYVDLIAPGTTLVVYGNSAYLVSGTSSSSASISGLIAGVADAQHQTVKAASTAVVNTPSLQFKPSK